MEMNGKKDLYLGLISFCLSILLLFFVINNPQEDKKDIEGAYFVCSCFILVGIFLMIKGFKQMQKVQRASLLGVHYQALVWSYDQDYSVQTNRKPTLMLVLRFIDNQGRLRQELFQTFTSNKSKFPLGGIIEVTEHDDELYVIGKKAEKKQHLSNIDKLIDTQTDPFSKTDFRKQSNFNPIKTATATQNKLTTEKKHRYHVANKVLQSLPNQLGPAKKVACPNCKALSIIMPGTTIICPCGKQFKLTENYKIA